VQAPDGAEAMRVGSALVRGLRRYVDELIRRARRDELARARDEVDILKARRNEPVIAAERRQKRRAVLDQRTVIRSAGLPVGGDVRDQTSELVLVLVFAAALAAWCIGLLLLSGLIQAIPRRAKPWPAPRT